MISNFFRSTCYSIVGIIFLVLISIIYIRKGKVGHKASTIFLAMIINSFLVCIVNFVFAYTFANFPVDGSINIIISRIYFLLLILWPFFLLEYIITYIYEKKNVKKPLIVRIFMIIFAISAFLSAYIFSYVPVTDLTRTITYEGTLYTIFAVENIIVSGFVMLLVFKNRKLFSNMNMVPPVFVYILYIIVIIAEYFLRFEVNFEPFFTSLIIACLYFTTESQDAQLIESYNEASIAAEDAVKAKTSFLNSLSTEIRSNLSHELGLTEILKYTDEKDMENIKNNIIKIKKTNDKTKYIIDSLFTLTDIENNKYQINNVNYNIRDMLDNLKYRILDEIDPAIYFDIDIKPGVPIYLNGDSDALQKILFSYILNAASFVKDNGKITLDVESQNIVDEANIIFNIRVNGILLNNNNFDLDYNDYISKDTNEEINGLKIGFISSKRLINILNGETKYTKVDDNNEIYVITIKQIITSDGGAR